MQADGCGGVEDAAGSSSGPGGSWLLAAGGGHRNMSALVYVLAGLLSAAEAMHELQQVRYQVQDSNAPTAAVVIDAHCQKIMNHHHDVSYVCGGFGVCCLLASTQVNRLHISC